MSEEIIKILDEIAKRFGIAIDWTSENVMPYVTDLFGRIVMYNKTLWMLGITVCVFVITASVAFAIISRKAKQKAQTKEIDGLLWWSQICYRDEIRVYETDLNQVLAVLATILVTAAVVFIPIAIIGLVKATFIPEVVVLKMLQGYM